MEAVLASPRARARLASPARPWAARVAAMAALAVMVLATAPAAHASCASPENPIVAENCKQGTPSSVWDVPGAGDDTIRGFATDISVNRGSTVQFKIDTSASSYRVDIYRMGYYGGDGARKVDTVAPTYVGGQPGCTTGSGGLVDCGNWVVSASWPVPSTAVSGIYFAHLVRTDGTPGESHIFFVVRDDGSHSDIYSQTSDTTWQAYNRYGGATLYTWSGGGSAPLTGGNTPRAAKVSYNRPFPTPGYS